MSSWQDIWKMSFSYKYGWIEAFARKTINAETYKEFA